MCEALQKRAKRKYINAPLIEHLSLLNSPLKSKYIDTLKCSSSIKVTDDGKTCTRYCKRTWCAICAPIRTAIRINNYTKSLNELQDLQFTTLTIANVPANEIKNTIQRFRLIFRQFRNTYKKATGLVFKGVYNFEVTYNYKTKLYHPHIHILHEYIDNFSHSDTGELCNDLIIYWLDHTIGETSAKAQDTRPCTDLIEGFKYQSKSIFKLKVKNQFHAFIPVVELDNIFQQIEGVRCFQPFGIKKLNTLTEEQEFQQLEAMEVKKPAGVYLFKKFDWHLFGDDSISLSDFIPDKKTISYHKNLTLNEYYSPPHER